MEEYEKQVLECHRAMEQAIAEPYSVKTLQLRKKLLHEELSELDTEIDSMIKELETNGTASTASQAKMMKELADLQYVLSGMVVSFDIPMQEAFHRVHTSNMSKLVNGKPLKREDGKFLKGPNFKQHFLDDLTK